MKADKTTTRWMRDASDELAVSNGCRFDEGRGQFAVDWIEEYLRLYEGVWAGRPFVLHDDWQYETTMRLFGWVRPNEEWRDELPESEFIRRFRRLIVFIPKKNKKSPTLAAWMAYVMGGEPGEEKCFPTAKNGKQIRKNVVRHFHEMIRKSPELSKEFVINRSTAEVFHGPTNSTMIPLSSDNVVAQQSNEGLNGSVFVDEVHVVDRAHIARVDRAGISRPEPIHAEVSTVGDDTDSYGYARFEYAEGVISGGIKDDETLAVIYAAPKDLADEDLFADPEKYGKMANPAWGHTVKRSEFLADLERSKKSLRDLADFKMYRLNIWQASAKPWIDMASWDACGGPVELHRDDPIYLGMDLASKDDFAALVAAQDQGGTIAVSGHYWTTEARARAHSDAGLPIYDWAEQGWVTICDGAEIDLNDVELAVLDWHRDYDVASAAHDPWGARGMRQRLADEHGVAMVEIPQNYRHLSDPSKALDAKVNGLLVAHSGDPVLRWMAKNATVKEDETSDLIRPVKPKRQSMKAIDGVVAFVMAIGEMEAMAGEVANLGVGVA